MLSIHRNCKLTVYSKGTNRQNEGQRLAAAGAGSGARLQIGVLILLFDFELQVSLISGWRRTKCCETNEKVLQLSKFPIVLALYVTLMGPRLSCRLWSWWIRMAIIRIPMCMQHK